MTDRPIRQALLSVSDKTGIVEFAQGLVQRGVKLLSTGGTAKLLEQHGLPVTEVSDYTGFHNSAVFLYDIGRIKLQADSQIDTRNNQ